MIKQIHMYREGMGVTIDFKSDLASVHSTLSGDVIDNRSQQDPHCSLGWSIWVDEVWNIPRTLSKEVGEEGEHACECQFAHKLLFDANFGVTIIPNECILMCIASVLP